MLHYRLYKNFFLIPIGVIIFTSCVKQFTINMPSNPINIVINSVFTVDSMPKIIITKERLITERSTNPESVFTPITNATITLYEDNKELTKQFAFNTTNGYYYNTNIKCKANSKYKIEVNAPGLISSSANYQAPEKFNSQLIETKKYSQSQYFPGGIFKENNFSSLNNLDSVLILKIKIPPFSSQKCFVLSSTIDIKIDNNNFKNNEFINVISPANIKQEIEEFFSDIDEQNNTYHINYPSYPYLIFTNQNYLNKEMNLEIILSKLSIDGLFKNSIISIDMFQFETQDYLKTFSMNSKESNDFILGLLEPSIIKSNTSNGLGYFGIKSVNMISIKY